MKKRIAIKSKIKVVKPKKKYFVASTKGQNVIIEDILTGEEIANVKGSNKAVLVQAGLAEDLSPYNYKKSTILKQLLKTKVLRKVTPLEASKMEALYGAELDKLNKTSCLEEKAADYVRDLKSKKDENTFDVTCDDDKKTLNEMIEEKKNFIRKVGTKVHFEVNGPVLDVNTGKIIPPVICDEIEDGPLEGAISLKEETPIALVSKEATATEPAFVPEVGEPGSLQHTLMTMNTKEKTWAVSVGSVSYAISDVKDLVVSDVPVNLRKYYSAEDSVELASLLQAGKIRLISGQEAGQITVVPRIFDGRNAIVKSAADNDVMIAAARLKKANEPVSVEVKNEPAKPVKNGLHNISVGDLVELAAALQKFSQVISK